MSGIALLLAEAAAQNVPGDGAWPQFRGPGRDGISQEAGLLQSWPTNGPPLRWIYEKCGKGYAGITLAEDRILTAGTFDEGTKVIALNRDGTLCWTAPNGTGRWRVPPDKKDWAGPHGGTRSTPTIADGRVFHLDVLGRLGAFHLATGAELWATNLIEAFKGVPNEWGYSESVLVESNRLYCLPGGSRGFLVCLDAATGRPVWINSEIPDKQASNSSAIIVDIEGVRQLITMTTVLITGVGVADGKLLWQTRHANRFRENCETPQYTNGVLFVSSGYGHGSEGYRIKKSETNTWSAAQIWRLNLADNLHGGPIIRDGHLYGAGYDHKGAFCIDIQSGKFKWRQTSIGRSSYAFAEGLFYRLGEDGKVALERLNPEKYECVSAFQIPSAKTSICLTHPVICGKQLYIRHQERLYRYDIAAGEKAAPPGARQGDPPPK